MSAAADNAAPAQWILPDWPAPANVRALITTRTGGVSPGPWGSADGGGMNLGDSCGDTPQNVAANRRRLREFLPAEPCWLKQVHGTAVVNAQWAAAGVAADAAFAIVPAAVCCVLVADCLPVLLTSADGRGVAAAHAGWRGLAGGVLQNAVTALRTGLADDSAPLLAYLGPAIGPSRFEVGPEVLDAMQQSLPGAASAFTDHAPGKLRADLFALARQALAQVGVTQVYGGGLCTMSDPERFYSFRHASPTGRQAALIWRNE